MPNVYGGELDARQSSNTDLPVSRFRPRYRALAITALEESCMWAVKELTA